MDPQLYKRVKTVLEINKAQRHIRGGLATKQKYSAERLTAKSKAAGGGRKKVKASSPSRGPRGFFSAAAGTSPPLPPALRPGAAVRPMAEAERGHPQQNQGTWRPRRRGTASHALGPEKRGQQQHRRDHRHGAS